MKSKGHICFVRIYRNPECADLVEYFERDGDVCRAPVINVIMPDGYRVGRYECPVRMWDQLKAFIASHHEIIV